MNDSKEHIITVASRLFLQKSYKEVTMKEIVDKTGLSKGAFYHYFESKEQLFLEVLDFFFTDIMKHAYEKYSRKSFYQFYHDYANEMKTFGKTYLDKFGENETEKELSMNYFSLAFDALKLFPEFKEKMLLGMKHEFEIWESVIKKARESGEINSAMSDEQIAQTFIYLSDGIGMHMIMEGAPIDEMVKPYVELWDKLYELMKA